MLIKKPVLKKGENLKICKSCVLSEKFPGISFSTDGICNYCANSQNLLEAKSSQIILKNRLAQAVKVDQKDSEYDCIVAFSGGKDSSYTLWYLSNQLHIRCLAITIDNGFLSDTAKKNCSAVTSSLGVDFQWFSPNAKFLFSLYQKSVLHPEMHPPGAIRRASVICNSCISLINNYMLITALQKKVPLIAGGYLGGQVPKDAVALEVNLQNASKTRAEQVKQWKPQLGAQTLQFFGIPKELIARSAMKSVTVINPMLALRVREEEVLECVQKLGWQKPLDTGKNSSNCRLNDLGIALHMEKFGFHPYALELSEQIRAGLMSRDAALEKINDRRTQEELNMLARPLGLAK